MANTRKRRDLYLLGIKVEPDLHAAVSEFAEKNDLTLSEAGRELLRAALEQGGSEAIERDLEDAGYQAGLRRAAHTVRTALGKLWE